MRPTHRLDVVAARRGRFRLDKLLVGRTAPGEGGPVLVPSGLGRPT
ncbi:hypothetical protein [Streptomyces sp. NPDC096012]